MQFVCKMGRNIVLFLLIGFISISQSARILGVIPTPAYSHQIVYQPLWEQLSRRGHEVVVLTTNPVNDPSLTNLTEIDISFTYNFRNEVLKGVKKNENIGFLKMFQMVSEFFINATRLQIEHPAFQNLIKNDSEHFDLVIVETLFPVYGALAHRFNSPLIGACSFEPWNEWLSAMGNPLSPAAFPNPNLPFFRNLSFKDRVIVSLYQFVAVPLRAYFYDDSLNELVYEYFGKDYPAATDFFSNLDMLFSYTNPVLKVYVPSLPTVIEFGGGIHIKPPKPLPEDIKAYLDGSQRGVIYFSLGSNMPSSLIKPEVKAIFLETLAELPYDVLWKFELDENDKIPSNVKVMKWLPQQDVLRHPNIKAFIMQGGLQSFEEALYSHVPLISIPFHADQGRNSKIMEYYNIGQSFDHHTLEKEPFKNAILKIAGDPSYKERIKELARLSKDQPMGNIDKLIWWTEYVIRNKGAKHLRSVIADMPFYKYYLLDVIGLVVFVMWAIYKCFKMFVNLLISCFRRKKNNKVKKE